MRLRVVSAAVALERTTAGLAVAGNPGAARKAAYLDHRYERVVEAVFPRYERRTFRFTRLGILGSRSRLVFWFTDRG